MYIAEFTTLKYCNLFLNDLPNIKLILFYNFLYSCHTREARVACFPQELAGNPARRAGWPASIFIYIYMDDSKRHVTYIEGFQRLLCLID